MIREIVIYVPAGEHRATDGIARGSAIVGRPRPGAGDVQIHYEGGVRGQSEMRTLADRAVHACGSPGRGLPDHGDASGPRDALVAVGTFDLATSRIILTGSRSEAAVAAWLDAPALWTPPSFGGGGHER